jgi:hypothetical protein
MEKNVLKNEEQCDIPVVSTNTDMMCNDCGFTFTISSWTKHGKHRGYLTVFNFLSIYMK